MPAAKYELAVHQPQSDATQDWLTKMADQYRGLQSGDLEINEDGQIITHSPMSELDTATPKCHNLTPEQQEIVHQYNVDTLDTLTAAHSPIIIASPLAISIGAKLGWLNPAPESTVTVNEKIVYDNDYYQYSTWEWVHPLTKHGVKFEVLRNSDDIADTWALITLTPDATNYEHPEAHIKYMLVTDIDAQQVADTFSQYLTMGVLSNSWRSH